MKQYIGRRVAYCALSLFLLSVTIFFFVRVTGDPATLLVEPGASEADIAALHHQFGLDRPLWVQYGLFMASLAQGDLGKSFYYRTPVMDLYLSRLPNSLYLGWLPSSGAGTPLHLIMPAFALGWYFAAANMRLTRSSMLEVLGSEYVKLARLKGLP